MINIFVLVTILGHLPVILSAKSKGSEDMKQILIVEDDIVGGQKNYDGVRVLGLYQLAQLKTVPVRQVDVQQHQIKFPLADSFGCGSGI